MTFQYKFLFQVTAFWRNKAANVAIITALSALPMIGLMGLSADYALAIMTKAKLDAAADAAATAALAAARRLIEANNGDTGSALTDGAARGTAIFNANMGAVGFLTGPPTLQVATVERSGQTLTETITYTATLRNNFGKLFNAATTQIKGNAVATLTVGQYLDFHLLLDVSGSMGLPSTSDGARQLKKINNADSGAYPGGCEFACHLGGNPGFQLARDNHIQLRADAVGNAVCQLLQTAKDTATMQKQYRVGVYPFIVDMEVFSALSDNLDNVMSDVNGGSSGGCSSSTPASALGNLLDVGDPSSDMGSGGTHLDIALQSMGKLIKFVGDGSSAGSPKPFVFLVTDGMQNDQGFKDKNWTSNSSRYWWSSGSHPRLMDPSDCNKIKQRAITVAVLNIPYQPIDPPNHSYSDDEDGKANTAINGNPNIVSTLKSCASPGFYFAANTPEDITKAMSQMFKQAVLQTRITN